MRPWRQGKVLPEEQLRGTLQSRAPRSVASTWATVRAHLIPWRGDSTLEREASSSGRTHGLRRSLMPRRAVPPWRARDEPDRPFRFGEADPGHRAHLFGG